MADVKLCKDCKHLTQNSNGGNCAAPQNLRAEPDFVNGGMKKSNPLWYGAQFCREDEKSCGPTAQWFEPKEPA